MGGKRSGEQVYFTWYLVFNVHLSSLVEYFERGLIVDCWVLVTGWIKRRQEWTWNTSSILCVPIRSKDRELSSSSHCHLEEVQNKSFLEHPYSWRPKHHHLHFYPCTIIIIIIIMSFRVPKLSPVQRRASSCLALQGDLLQAWVKISMPSKPSNTLQRRMLCIFIEPESDHCLPLSLTNWLTHCCLVKLIDVTLACEDANSKHCWCCCCWWGSCWQQFVADKVAKVWS